MAGANTLNICVSHIPFPTAFGHYVDLTLAPRPLDIASPLIVAPDENFGAGGRALAEYAQLAWLSDHFDEIVGGHDFIRLVQYRRFVSRAPMGRPTNCFFANYIGADELGAAEAEFDRHSETGLVNSPVAFPEGGTLAQYAVCHILDDMLAFSAWLIEAGLFTPLAVARFLEEERLIPAGGTGLFPVAVLREIGAKLRSAADFVNSPRYIARKGYQRRLGGFLLERLNSHLLMNLAREGRIKAAGHYIYISEDGLIQPTV
jgi:hypothetical protein